MSSGSEVRPTSTSWWVPEDFVVRAAAVLRAVLDATVTVRQDGVSVPAVSSTPAAARCDRAAVRSRSAPWADAMEHHRVQLVAQVGQESRWPEWSGQTAQEGFASAVAVPASVAPGVDLALTLYSRSADPWDAGLLVAADGYAQLLASSARGRLTAAGPAPAPRRDELADAVTIERAVGAIMHTNGCSADEAHHILASASSNRNVPRREVARQVLQALLEAEAHQARTR